MQYGVQEGSYLMLLNLIREVPTDPRVMQRGYHQWNGFVFVSNGYPHNVYDAIHIKNYGGENTYAALRNMELSSRTLEEHVALINQYQLDKAAVREHNLEFLRNCPSLRHITIAPSVVHGKRPDFSPLYDMPKIQSVAINSFFFADPQRDCEKLDYTRINGLEMVHVGQSDDCSFREVPTLKSMSVRDAADVDVSGLFCSKELDSLRLITCKIKSLDGIEKAPKMQVVRLHYNRSLQNIDALVGVKDTLRALTLEKCSRVKDLSVLERLVNLEHLWIEGNQTLPSLDFIRKLPKLKTFIFDVLVEDGDMTPCEGLEYVYCNRSRKHYNIKDKDLPKREYFWGDDNIDEWRRLRC